jgi:hypothetical protein
VVKHSSFPLPLALDAEMLVTFLTPATISNRLQNEFYLKWLADPNEMAEAQMPDSRRTRQRFGVVPAFKIRLNKREVFAIYFYNKIKDKF